jgi:glucose-6-phosphate 1-epimerase
MNALNTLLADGLSVQLSDTRALYNSAEALPVLIVDTPLCHAVIALQGAQLLSFQPKGDMPWLWLSPHAIFARGHAIRGGIPLCLPWFGVNSVDPTKPKHGFVRNRDWQLLWVNEADAAVTLCLEFQYAGDQPELFTTAFTAQLSITLAADVMLALQLRNDSRQAAEFSWALHSYFAVDDLGSAQVDGLDGCDYLDNTRRLNVFQQLGAVKFGEEVDRVFARTSAPQFVQAQHRLQISGENCPTCIVWNVGEKVSGNIADIREAYRRYICVERGCAFGDSFCLSAGASVVSTMHLALAEDSRKYTPAA